MLGFSRAALIHHLYDVLTNDEASAPEVYSYLSEAFIARLEHGNVKNIPLDLVEPLCRALGLNEENRRQLYLALVPDIGPLSELRRTGFISEKVTTGNTSGNSLPEVIEPPTTDILEASRHSKLSDLTQRQQEVLRLSMYGKTSEAIADSLTVTKETVDTHWNRIRERLKINRRKDVIEYAKKQRWFENNNG
jgi:DNA-binding CsgD family transcriptional regulator